MAGQSMTTRDPSVNKDHIKPACRCGVPIKPNTTRYGVDDGRCYRHPERGTDAWKKRSQL